MISSVRKSDNKLYFHELPTDVLLHIFQFSDLKTLLSLSCCCKRFYSIISDDSVWTSRSKVAIITNQSSKDIIKRSSKFLRAKQKCRISVNWRLGSYSEKCFSTRIRYMPKLLLEKSRLWMSQGADIYLFKRQDSYVHWKKPENVLSNGHAKDVCNFVKLDSLILSGGRDGKVYGWSEISGKLLFERNCHISDELRCISASRDIFVTGSKQSFLKVWKVNENGCSDKAVSIFCVNDSLWSLAVDPLTKYVCCGTAGLSCREAVNLFDLESGIKTSYSVRKGSAIFDIKWESSSTFLTCGYDSFLRLWDTRTKECVISWMDPFDAAGYCIASDNCNSVLCGTARNSRVQLWDMRMKLSVQSFFCKSSSSSPVYSVTFDPCCMFAALDLSLNVLDFSGDLKTKNDYRSAWGG